MKGIFLSKKIKNRKVDFLGRNITFNSIEELANVLNDWTNALVRFHLASNFVTKGKVYHFSINNMPYYIELPRDIKILPIIDNMGNIWTDNPQNINLYISNNETSLRNQLLAIIDLTLHPKENDKSIALCEDIFINRPKRLIDDTIETIFHDNEAINLCKKMSTPFIRELLNNYRNHVNDFHQLAMKCLAEYGSQLLSFLISLPNMKFGCKESEFLLENKYSEVCIPSFKIKFSNDKDEYIFSFYPPRKLQQTEGIRASIYNKSKGIIEGFITPNGHFQQRLNNEKIRPSLFIQNIVNRKIIFCGVDLGFCINCGRELSDPSSLRLGYGKDCAMELGISD